jgi:hypothetical protein
MTASRAKVDRCPCCNALTDIRYKGDPVCNPEWWQRWGADMAELEKRHARLTNTRALLAAMEAAEAAE